MNEDLQSKIQNLLAEGVPLHVEFDEPLTPEDRERLNGQGRIQMVTYVIFGCGLAAVPFLASEEELAAVWKVVISCAVGVSYSTLLVLLHRKMARAYRAPKKVIQGFVTGKSIKKLEKSTYYYLTIGTDQEIRVSSNQYHRFEIGDAVEAHRFSGWGTVLLSLRKYDGQDLKVKL